VDLFDEAIEDSHLIAPAKQLPSNCAPNETRAASD
jgi:hypothetical protein